MGSVIFRQILSPPPLETFVLPGSKSLTNRALLLAALARGRSTLRSILLSDDTEAVLNGLRALGVSVLQQKTTVIIDGVGRFPKRTATLHCDASGIAARFFLALCAAHPGEYQLDASFQLRQRPLLALVDALQSQGVQFISRDWPIHFISSGLLGGELSIHSAESSQFVSALLMSAPFMKQPLHLSVENLNRDAFIQMTIAMMSLFGVSVHEQDHQYVVRLPQTYRACEWTIEPDASTASYFFARAALLGHHVLVKGLQRTQSLQGDLAFLTVLENMGCVVDSSVEGITVAGPQQLQGVSVDMNNFSDTFLTVACLAPFAATPTTLTGLRHTRGQESDRIAAIAKVLQAVSVPVATGEDWIRIDPAIPKAATVSSQGDHRVAMSAALLGLKTPGLVIEQIEAVSKTFPDFFTVFSGQ